MGIFESEKSFILEKNLFFIKKSLINHKLLEVAR